MLNFLGLAGNAWNSPMGSHYGNGPTNMLHTIFGFRPMQVLINFAENGYDSAHLFDDGMPRFQHTLDALREQFVEPTAEYWQRNFLRALDGIANANAAMVAMTPGAGLSERAQLRANKKYIASKVSNAFDHVFGWERYERWLAWVDEWVDYLDTKWVHSDLDVQLGGDKIFESLKNWSPILEGSGAFRQGSRRSRGPVSADQSGGVVLRSLRSLYESATNAYSHAGEQIRSGCEHLQLVYKYYRFRQEFVEKLRMVIQAIDEEQ